MFAYLGLGPLTQCAVSVCALVAHVLYDALLSRHSSKMYVCAVQSTPDGRTVVYFYADANTTHTTTADGTETFEFPSGQVCAGESSKNAHA